MTEQKYLLQTAPYVDKNVNDLSIKELQSHYERVKSKLDDSLKLSDEHKNDSEFIDQLGSYDRDVKMILRVLDKKRNVRNDHFLNWLFEDTPNWDLLSSDDLIELFERSSIKYGDSTSGGGGAKKEKQLDPQDVEALEREKLKPSDDESHSTHLDMATVESPSKPEKRIQLMRAVSNRDMNDPIDTQAELQEGLDLRSPLSNRDVEGQMDDYMESHESVDSIRDRAKKKYAKKIKDAFLEL